MNGVYEFMDYNNMCNTFSLYMQIKREAACVYILQLPFI